jgi:hypothetical protein
MPRNDLATLAPRCKTGAMSTRWSGRSKGDESVEDRSSLIHASSSCSAIYSHKLGLPRLLRSCDSTISDMHRSGASRGEHEPWPQ